MTGPQSGTRGSSLLEALVGLAITLAAFSALIPTLLHGHRLALRVARVADQADAGRLTALRLLREARRAGFGLDPGDGDAIAIDAGGTRVRLRLLEDGFQGALPLALAAPAGGLELELTRLGGLQAGDEVSLRDRAGRAHAARALSLDRARRRVGLDRPLPFAAHPQSGAALFVVVTRTFELEAGTLRFDGSTAIDPDTEWRVAEPRAGDPASLLTSLVAPPVATLVPARAFAARLRIATPATGALTVATGPPLDLLLAVAARQEGLARAAGSPLP